MSRERKWVVYVMPTLMWPLVRRVSCEVHSVSSLMGERLNTKTYLSVTWNGEISFSGSSLPLRVRFANNRRHPATPMTLEASTGSCTSPDRTVQEAIGVLRFLGNAYDGTLRAAADDVHFLSARLSRGPLTYCVQGAMVSHSPKFHCR